MKGIKSPVLFSLVSLAAALSVSGAAMATTPLPATSPASSAGVEHATPHAREHKRGHKHNKMRHHRQHRNAAFIVPGYGALSDKQVESLNLTEAQQKQVADAKAAQKSARSERAETMKAVLSARAEKLKEGKLDPHAALADRKTVYESSQRAHQAVTEKWLAAWDGLSADQQSQVAGHLSAHAEKRAELIQKRAERMEKRRSEAG